MSEEVIDYETILSADSYIMFMNLNQKMVM